MGRAAMEIALTSVSPGVVDTTSLDQGFISAGPASGTGPTFSRVPGCDAEAAALGSAAATADPGATGVVQPAFKPAKVRACMYACTA